MKLASQLNPLRNPVAPGEQVKAGGRIYWADTDMDGKWRVYEIALYGDSINARQLVVSGIESQVELCAWLQRRDEESQHGF